MTYFNTAILEARSAGKAERIGQIMDAYRKEYERVNGRTPEVEKRGRWIRVNGNAYSLKEIISALDVLKKRASFYP